MCEKEWLMCDNTTNRAIFGSLSRGGLQFLGKLAKGIKGIVNIDFVKDALAGIDGWAITDTSMPIAITDSDQLKKLFAGFGENTIWGYSGTKEEKKYFYGSREAAEEGGRQFIRAISHVGPKGPPTAKPGERFYNNISGTLANSWDNPDRWWFAVVGIWYGVPGWIIKAPSGQTLKIPQKLDDRGRLSKPTEMKSAAFWKFAYANGLQEQAQKVLTDLGQETVDKIVRPSQVRSLAGTGTCPVCFRNIKLKGERIMRHGWNVQGQRSQGMYGMTWHTGPCFGAGLKPFEVSSDGTKAYLSKVLEPILKTRIKRLQDLKKRPATLKVSLRPRKIEEITPDHPSYERQLEIEIVKVGREIKSLKEEIKTCNTRIQRWKPQPLPV
jgi:hypothetical protein